MRLDEADKLLADLARKCEFATQNLIEFGEQPICKRLRGEAGWEKPELNRRQPRSGWRGARRDRPHVGTHGAAQR